MTKLVPILIGGKQVVQLSQLTIDQANDLRSFLPPSSIIKLNYKGMELNECIDFSTYEYWFQAHHAQECIYSNMWEF